MEILNQLQASLSNLTMNFSYNMTMIDLYLRDHSSRLLFMTGALVLFLLLLQIIRTERQKRLIAKAYQPTPEVQFTLNKEFETIAGDNPITTKLDLARAYIEMGKMNLAKNILINVQKQGTDKQQQEAKRLLERL